MLNKIIIIFLVAAIGGLFMAYKIFKNEKPPFFISGVHGLLAAVGLGLLVFTQYAGTDSTPIRFGTSVLVLAALGGFFLLSFHLRKKPHPKPVVILHAALAVSGVAALVYAIL